MTPWINLGLSFIDEENIIFTESGKLYTLNLKNKKIFEIKHNLSVLEVGQGGLLDVLYDERKVYISYSKMKAIGRQVRQLQGEFNKKNIIFKYFPGKPSNNSGYHFGSRLVIKNKHLYVTAGEEAKE